MTLTSQMSIFIIVNVDIYLRDLRQTAKVGWEKVEGLLLVLSRKTMAMLFLKWLIGCMDPWMFSQIKGNGNTIRANRLL